jgi:hypothetical protein
VVPAACGDDAAGADDASHLADGDLGVCEEAHDELGERGVEGGGRPWQLLGRSLPHLRAGKALGAGEGESRGWIDRRHPLGAHATRKLAGQGARPTADVEHALAGLDLGEVRKKRRQPPRVAAHVGVVVVG